jgi:ubiquinone biosynthesis monooxygenase Coq7
VSAVITGKKETRQDTCNRIIKVNHAGEFGAINIYRAQIIAARLLMPGLQTQLEEFLSHERRHLATFAQVLRARGIPRCRSFWLCGIGGFALGLVSSLFGRSGIMACTASVETVVTEHLVEQLRFLESAGDWEAAQAVRSIVADEEDHKAIGVSQGQQSWVFKPLGAVVAMATSSVIWLGMML